MNISGILTGGTLCRRMSSLRPIRSFMLQCLKVILQNYIQFNSLATLVQRNMLKKINKNKQQRCRTLEVFSSFDLFCHFPALSQTSATDCMPSGTNYFWPGGIPISIRAQPERNLSHPQQQEECKAWLLFVSVGILCSILVSI